MNWKTILTKAVTWAWPFIQKMIESKVIPAAIRKMYEFFDVQKNYIVEKLFELFEKWEATLDPIKKAAHLEGLKLGIATIEAIGKSLVEVAEILNKKVGSNV